MGAVTSTVAARFAFFPPSPPSYGLEQPQPQPQPPQPSPPPPVPAASAPAAPQAAAAAKAGEEKGGRGGGGGGGAVVELTGVPRRGNVEARRLRTKRGTEVVAMHVRQAGAKLTLLYSHGNAADLGQMYELFVELSAHLNVNLMGYDYSGYGQSTGKPSEQNTYADIEAVYRCLIETYGAAEDNIILYGQSVGSGPTLDLASRLTRLRAVVLHSPILSGLRVMYPVKHTYWFDIYKNIDKIPLVRCPVLVIHGTADEVVDCSHGRSLWELAQVKYEPLWIKGGNHCNLELYPEYIKHLKKFVGAIERSPPPPPADESSTESSGPSSRTPSTEPECNSAEDSRKSTDCRDKTRPSIDQRHSTDRRDKPRGSTDRRDKTRKSVDHPDKPRASVDQSDRPRKSIDRFGGMMKSVRLCNIDCFKVTATSGS